jgi:hypothetical protein
MTAGARSTRSGTIALSTNDLGDAGLTAQESAELNRLLLELVRATRGRQDTAGER